MARKKEVPVTEPVEQKEAPVKEAPVAEPVKTITPAGTAGNLSMADKLYIAALSTSADLDAIAIAEMAVEEKREAVEGKIESVRGEYRVAFAGVLSAFNGDESKARKEWKNVLSHAKGRVVASLSHNLKSAWDAFGATTEATTDGKERKYSAQQNRARAVSAGEVTGKLASAIRLHNQITDYGSKAARDVLADLTDDEEMSEEAKLEAKLEAEIKRLIAKHGSAAVVNTVAKLATVRREAETDS